MRWKARRLLTQLRILEPFGIRSHNGRLDDASPAQQEMLLARLDDDYATLHRYDASRHTGQDRLSYEIFDYFVGMQVRGGRWRYHNYPVNQLFGVQSMLPNLMTQEQQVNDATDAEHYIARLAAYPAQDGAGDRGHAAARKQRHRAAAVRRGESAGTDQAVPRPGPEGKHV